VHPHGLEHLLVPVALRHDGGVRVRVHEHYAKVSITLDRYSHVTESLRRDAAMAIDRALREAGYQACRG